MNISITIPSNAVLGTTFARFRVSQFSTALTNGPYGFEGDVGEIEDYQVTIELPKYDFGDAPTGYLTLLGEVDGSGRRAPYTSAGNIYLGSSVTTETNGVHSPDASADVGDNGVVFGNAWKRGKRCR